MDCVATEPQDRRLARSHPATNARLAPRDSVRTGYATQGSPRTQSPRPSPRPLVAVTDLATASTRRLDPAFTTDRPPARSPPQRRRRRRTDRRVSGPSGHASPASLRLARRAAPRSSTSWPLVVLRTARPLPRRSPGTRRRWRPSRSRSRSRACSPRPTRACAFRAAAGSRSGWRPSVSCWSAVPRPRRSCCVGFWAAWSSSRSIRSRASRTTLPARPLTCWFCSSRRGPIPPRTRVRVHSVGGGAGYCTSVHTRRGDVAGCAGFRRLRTRRRLGTLIQPGIGLAACTGLGPDHRRGVRLPHRRGRRVRDVCAGRRASSSRPSMVVT